MDEERLRTLTRAEREVLRLLAEGSRPGEIARQLDRSVSTVNNHLQSARSKLGTSDSVAAARALKASEASGQKVPSHELPMVPYDQAQAVTTPQEPDVRGPTVLNEERALFGHAPKSSFDGPAAPAERRINVRRSRWRTLGAVLCLTLALMACIALAPAMAETFQLIIDRLYPPPR